MKAKKIIRFIIMLPCLLLLFMGCKTTPIDFPQGEYPNGQLLVAADFLETIMDQSGVVIIDARSSGYETSHIPGAISLKWSDYVDASTKLLPVADLQTKLSAAGLNSNMTFIIYDDTIKSWGAAGRVFWMLEYLGCSDVHILNGGWDLWKAEGRDTETSANTLSPNIFIASVRDNVISTKDYISSRMNDSDFIVIDSRTDEEYNGWQLYGEARGGHIPGAVQIPYEWFYVSDNNTVLSYENLKNLFETRGVTSDKEVTSYCTAGIRSGFVYFALRLLGYQNCSNYANSIQEWAADSSLEMEKLPHYEKLVSVSWLKDLLDGKSVPNAPAGRYLVVGTEWAGDSNGLIPGSILVSASEWEMLPTEVVAGAGDLWPSATLKANFESMGIDKDTTVIVYGSVLGDTFIYATRLLWALMYAGVEDVRLLNGGIDKWQEYGYDVVTTPAEREHVDFGISLEAFPVHPEYLATTEYIEEVVNGQHTDAVIADIRSWGEYIGGPNDYLTIGIPLTVQGRIPGARWAHWGPSTLGGGDFWDDDHTLSSYPEVQALWTKWGITGDKTVSYYCGTGWRSTLGWFYGYLMGWGNIKNYDDSFFGWSMTSANASAHGIETGIPSDAPEDPTAE